VVNSLYTEFAPAKRTDFNLISAQVKQVAAVLGESGVLNLVPEALFIVNSDRQIVFANKIASQLLESGSYDSIYGLRPGELLDCTHASESKGGCGTTKFCSACGAVKAILKGLKGQETVEECRVIQKKSGNALDLRIWVYPMLVADQPFEVFVAQDISDEKRRRALEHIFFHDILNTASGIYSFAGIVAEANEEEQKEFLDSISKLTNRLIDEINSQRELMKAENRELTTSFKQLDSLELITDLAAQYKKNEVSRGKRLVVAPGSQSVIFDTDGVLLARVLGNMLKNALEASLPEETVTLKCIRIDNCVEFSVHNQAFISLETQLQIFLRSFSTKSSSRGLGTYSMRLLSERYLKGKVWFTSSQKEGTTFYASYPLSLHQ
jgi:hypothetical protein